jgi:transposase
MAITAAAFVGATATMRLTHKNADGQFWMEQLLQRKPAKTATVAVANKTTCIA